MQTAPESHDAGKSSSVSLLWPAVAGGGHQTCLIPENRGNWGTELLGMLVRVSASPRPVRASF